MTHNELRELVFASIRSVLRIHAPDGKWITGPNNFTEAAAEHIADELECLLTQSPVVNQGLTAEGWVVVPRTVTPEIEAVYGNDSGAYQTAQELHDAMLAAAPAAECPSCEKDGVWATDGTGPYDCYTCGKKAAPAVEVDEAMVEAGAREVYADMVYDEPGEKPAWVERGNSLKQGEARRMAHRVLAAALGREVGRG
ncbi:hypothetical protein [Lysobacter enzymogenes]|uniref:hypothetical protein n=1 Tax=Lysobacter enzymogenes TaxID=69 RepID=UPI001A9687CE|nr:hypothetical protein [Lysobacter enzymogenes]QQP96463.1 hypothetical protein JHW38_25255 [Lysobacter enzymogenes]QQP96497.1 hypothetical protein JHW38_00105 [Lysobacter enzymogenes]